MNENITLIIPTHNEEKIILRALTSVENQILNDLAVKVIVVPNGCIDKTEQTVKNFIKNSTNKKLSWKVKSFKEGHRTKALNYGISQANTEIIMYLNPDCVIENNAVSIMHNRITSTKELNYIGMLEEPELSFVLPETTLYKTIQIIWYNRKISNTHPPSGRFVALRKEIFPRFPEIHSEDTWASLYSYKNYGPKSIMVIKEPTVKYIPYKNWVDFMKVESRYMEGTYEVYAKYPGYKELYNKRATENKISDEKKLELMKSFCEDHNIDFKILLDIKDVIFPLVIENAKLMRQIGESGTWELIK